MISFRICSLSRSLLLPGLAFCVTTLSTLHGLEPARARPADSRSANPERPPVSLKEEQASLDAWLEHADSVDRGRQSERIFRLAESLAASGELDGALRYFQLGLQANAWDLERQLKYGELLGQKGQEPALQERAELVLRHAETDALLLRASPRFSSGSHCRQSRRSPAWRAANRC